MSSKEISLQQLIGKGYADFWHCKKLYRVCKGSRASKKSTTTAINIIYRMMAYPLANTLVVRKTGTTLEDSCYAQLIWAINALGVTHLWRPKKNPLQIIYIKTGQKILFKGLDDPKKATSVTVDKGYLCWLWVEEAYEITEEDFNTLDESIRGVLPEGYFTQATLTFNPWDSSSWLKTRFFDVPDEDVFVKTTNYKCNEWLSESDLRKFERMKKFEPERYKVAGLGDWGLAGGQFFKQWRPDIHVIEPFEIPGNWLRFRAMDWGSSHPYSCHWYAVDHDGNMYCYRELYGWGGKPNVGTEETAAQVGERIAELEKKSEEISYGVLDSACWAKTGVTGPTIAEELNNVLYEHGLVTFGKCSKGRIEAGNAIKQRLIGTKGEDGEYEPAIFFFSTCVHMIRTLPMLGYDKHNPETYDTAGEDHCVDDLAYACLSRPWAPPEPSKDKPIDRWKRHHEDKPSAWTF